MSIARITCLLMSISKNIDILFSLEEFMKKTKIICTMGPNTNDREL